ncbi:helix-turn-helix domain-containing protein [Candidatus Bathyarchaeota archaeon]|jgi:DNA-binding transcriptional ArsR family regulator|nr:helix-turn-helix domain-containing protein [Candidatus Bathyarchaeota archaeon]
MSDGRNELNELRDEVAILRKQLSSIAEKLDKSVEDQSEAVETLEESGHNKASIEHDETVESEDPDSETFEERDHDWNYGRRHYDNFGRGRIGSDWGDKLGDYISDMVDSVMENVTTELERNLYTGTRSPKSRPTVMTDMEVERTVRVMSALGNEHRIKILEELSWGGAYASDLQEALDEISPSTLSSHLDVLQEAGMILQERKRGRYLITMAGRIAIQMAAQLAKRANVIN